MIRRAGLALVLAGVVAAASLAGAAEPPDLQGVMIVPFAVTPERDDNRWVAPAIAGSLRFLGQRVDLPLLEDGPTAPPPFTDLHQVTAADVRAWLGPEMAGKARTVLLGRARVTADNVSLSVLALDLAGAGPGRELTLGGQLSRLPSLLGRVTAHLAQTAGSPLGDEREKRLDSGLSTSREALERFAAAQVAGDLEGRVLPLEEALAVDPSFAAAGMLLGLTRYQLGRRDGAREAFLAVTTSLPKPREAFNNLGVILGEENRLEEAVAAFRQALAADPGYLDARVNLARVLDQGKRYDEALAEYDTLLGAYPDRTDLRFRRGLILDRLGRTEAAVEEFRRISPSDPERAERFFLREGVKARQEKRFADAELYFKRAQEINPTMSEVYRERGATAFQAGNYEAAAGFLRTAAERLPGAADVHQSLGMALLRLERRDEARESFARSAELGGVPEANLELARIFVAEGRAEDAVAALNRLLAAAPGNDEGRALLAEVVRSSREQGERIRRDSEQAVRRVEKLEGIVAELNRRNLDLEGKLAVAQEGNRRNESELARLRDEKAALEAGTERQRDEATTALREMTQRLDGMRGVQENRIRELETALQEERLAKREIEEGHRQLAESVERERTAGGPDALAQAEVLRLRERLEAMKTRAGELDLLLEQREAGCAQAVAQALAAQAGAEARELAARERTADRDGEIVALRRTMVLAAAAERRAADALRKAREERGAEAARLAGSLKALEDGNRSLEKRLDSREAEGRRLQKDLSAAATEREALNKRLEVLEKERAAARARVADLERSLFATVAEKDRLAAERERRGAGSKEDERRLAAVQKELQDLKTGMEGLRRRLSDSLQSLIGLQRERGQLPRAVETAELLVQVVPLDGAAWLMLGELYRQAGDGRRSKEALERAADLQEGGRQ